jgi:hypothetical protein
MNIPVWSKQNFRPCDDVHGGVGGNEVGVFFVSVMLVMVVGVMRFAGGLLLLEVCKVVLVVLAYWLLVVVAFVC